MAKKKIKEIVGELLKDFLNEHGYELYNVEFVKEVKDWFLRVYIDKINAGESDYVSTDDCELVSRYLSEKLDKADPIEQNYFLEVSSPGMDRELFLPKHYSKFAGRAVEIKLYKAIEGQKLLTGILIGYEDEKLILENENNETIQLPIEQVAKTKLAVII